MTKTMKTCLTAGLLTGFALSVAPLAAAAAPQPTPLVLDLSKAGDAQILLVRRGRGADDGAAHTLGDDKGRRKAGKGRGRDDGPNHT